MSKKAIVQFKDLNFNYQGEDPLFEDLKFTILEGDVTALVGVNGSGKSTLLKLLIGELSPVEGTIQLDCKPYYVPQVDLTIQQSNITIYDYISQYYENWWEINYETERLFDLTLNTEAEARTLSGGELMKLNLAIAIKNSPDFLILDEPTNHLDVKSIGNLINFIKKSKTQYTFLIVSHDTYFLDQVVTKVLNLENGNITTYGGNYTFYTEQKALHLGGLKKQYNLAKHKLEAASAQAQADLEKQEHKAAKTKKDIHEGKEKDKYIIAAKKESGASTAKAAKINLERKKSELSTLLETFEPAEERKLAFMQLKNVGDPANRLIFEISNAKLKIGEKTLISELNWKVSYGDRIAVAGDNASGKTSLIKALLKLGNANTRDTILGDAQLEGDIVINKDLKWVYIDQNYSSVNPDLTLVENLMAYNSSYTEDMAKSQLGKFQFKTVNEMNKLGKNLSGGEMVRLIMAMITAFPIDMIILDEPTNNLDVETVDTLIEALVKFRGAVVVISHNIAFLNSIGVKNSYIIRDSKFTQMRADPSQKDNYYKELIS